MQTCQDFYDNTEEVTLNHALIWPCGCPSEKVEGRNLSKIKVAYETWSVFVACDKKSLCEGNTYFEQRKVKTEEEYWEERGQNGLWTSRTRRRKSTLPAFFIACDQHCPSQKLLNIGVQTFLSPSGWTELEIFQSEKPDSSAKYWCRIFHFDDYVNEDSGKYGLEDIWKYDEIMVPLTEQEGLSVERGELAARIKKHIECLYLNKNAANYMLCECDRKFRDFVVCLDSDSHLESSSESTMPLLPIDDVIRLLNDDSDDEGYVSSDSHSSFF